jgi:tetratricopeptide (TPR) repeat protein
MVFTIVLLVFAPIARNGFVAWDDDYTIQANPFIQQPSIPHMLHYWRHAFMDLYVPVTYTLWTIVGSIWKWSSGGADAPDPRFFHAASILVHAFNALLVYGLLARLLKNAWAAAGGALLFALHPVQVETVAWASGMKDLLCGMFTLIALNQYVRAVQPAEEHPRPRLHHGLAMLAMMLAMLSKPTAMITPLLAMAIDRFMLGRSRRSVFRSIWPYFLLAVPCVVWAKMCQPPNYLRHIPLWQRPIVALDAVAFYIGKLLAPVHLGFDYGRAPWVIFQKKWAWFTWLVPGAIAGLLIRYRKAAPPLLAGALLFVAALAPVLGFSTFDFEMISTVADHYLYLAMLGPALAAGWMLTRLRIESRAPALVVCAVLALLAARSVDQAHNWHDSRRFFSHALEVNPQSWSSWFGLAYIDHNEGRDLAARATAQAGAGALQLRASADDRLNEAMECYQRAIEFNAYDVGAHHGYGAMLMYFGRYREAAREFIEVVRRRETMNPAARPQYYADTDLLGQCLLMCGHPREAVHAFRAALQLNPSAPDVQLHLRGAEAVLASEQARSRSAITDTARESSDSADGDD